MQGARRDRHEAFGKVGVGKENRFDEILPLTPVTEDEGMGE